MPVFSQEDADLAALTWSVNEDGYAHRSVKVGGKWGQQKAHRVVGARIAGRALSRREEIDHFNGNRLDNTRDNLLIVTRQQNAENKRRSPTTGAYYDARRGRWYGRVKHRGRQLYTAAQSSREAAGAAAAALRRELKFHGEPPGA